MSEEFNRDDFKRDNFRKEDFKRDEHECLCKSKGFKKFLAIALGSFVGVYLALCLFCATHRPPAMPGPNPYMMGGALHHCDCCCSCCNCCCNHMGHKKMMKKFMKHQFEEKFKNMENKKEIED